MYACMYVCKYVCVYACIHLLPSAVTDFVCIRDVPKHLIKISSISIFNICHVFEVKTKGINAESLLILTVLLLLEAVMVLYTLYVCMYVCMYVHMSGHMYA